MTYPKTHPKYRRQFNSLAPPERAPQFFLPARRANGLKPRTSSAVMAEIRAALAALPASERTFALTQDLARQHNTNGQIIWRIALVLGAPVRNIFRSPKKLSGEVVEEAERRFNAGEQISDLAVVFNCSVSALRNRLEALDQQREEAAALIAAARERERKVLARGKYTPSSFILPLSRDALMAGKARPATRERNCDLSAGAPLDTP